MKYVNGDVDMRNYSRTNAWARLFSIALISALLFLAFGLLGGTSGGSVDQSQIQDTISQYFNVSLLSFLPVILIFVLSAFRFSSIVSFL